MCIEAFLSQAWPDDGPVIAARLRATSL